jgi:hypothetical protein
VIRLVSFINSKFDHFFLVLQKPLDIDDDVLHKLLLLARTHVSNHFLQHSQKTQLHQVTVELLVRKDIENSVDGLTSPFL